MLYARDYADATAPIALGTLNGPGATEILFMKGSVDAIIGIKHATTPNDDYRVEGSLSGEEDSFANLDSLNEADTVSSTTQYLMFFYGKIPYLRVRKNSGTTPGVITLSLGEIS